MEELKTLGSDSEADYQEHQRWMQASKDMAHDQKVASIAAGSTAFRSIYEVTAAGFNADTDETDDLVFWVAAPSEDDVKAVIQDTGAKFCGMVTHAKVADADFTLPAQSMALSSTLLEKASDFRNRDRHVARRSGK